MLTPPPPPAKPRSNASRLTKLVVSLAAAAMLSGCMANMVVRLDDDSGRMIAKNVSSYEEEGKRWGEKHLKQKLQPGGQTDQSFVDALVNQRYIDFFWVHAELKEAFKKGYRIGYQDRTADLLLGPHLTAAAEAIGGDSAGRFVEVVNTFEQDWAATLKRAVDVFITLISEGSQADREKFITNFEAKYDEKYRKTRERLKSGGFITQVSEGGTTLYLDATKTLALLNIPATSTLKAEVYQQTFRVMGDEWGKRLSHNLVKRDELVDLLRRSKTALQEGKPGFLYNLGLLSDAFIASYGTDAESVFRGLIRDAEYPESAMNSLKKK